MKRFSVPIKYGVFVALALIGYFLLLSLLGVSENPAYSILNIPITAFGIYLCIKKYKQKKGGKFKFRKGFMAGITCGFVATVLFTGFFAVYSTEIVPDFQERLLTMWESDWFVNTGAILFTVALMGFVTSVVTTFAIIQLLKPSWNTEEAKKHTY